MLFIIGFAQMHKDLRGLFYPRSIDISAKGAINLLFDK